MVTKAKISNLVDEETKAMLYKGANLSQLSILFAMDHRVLVERLHDCPPSGTRNGANIYKISDCAPYLVKPAIDDIDDRIKKMNHADLPKMLTKEYWAGKRSRQLYEQAAGDLWSTQEVVTKVGEVLKIFKMSTRLFVDALSRQTEVTDKQRGILINLADGMLEECSASVVTNFQKKKTATASDDDEL